jgi:hypothetical protein
LNLERGGMRGMIGRSRERKKIGFLVLGKYNIFFFFDMFSSFQPSLWVSHGDVGTNFIL